MRLIYIIVLLFSFPALADDVQRWLDSLPPLSEDQRGSFDKAAIASYSPNCNCFRFLQDTDVLEFPFPMGDEERYLVIESLRRGLIVPMVSSGDGV